jgi:hypothetical protein
LHDQRAQLYLFPTWRDFYPRLTDPAARDSSQPAQPGPSKQAIVISSDDDEEAIDKIVRRLQRRKKEKEVIVISSDDDEPLVETIVPRKRKARSSGGESSNLGARKKRSKIRIFEPEVILVPDSDEEMTVVE